MNSIVPDCPQVALAQAPEDTVRVRAVHRVRARSSYRYRYRLPCTEGCIIDTVRIHPAQKKVELISLTLLDLFICTISL